MGVTLGVRGNRRRLERTSQGFTSGGRRANRCMAVLRLVAMAAVLAACARGDEIELSSGKRYQGRLIQKTPSQVTFKIVFPQGGSLEANFSASEVRSLKIDGKEPVFETPAPATRPRSQPATQPSAAPRPNEPPKPPDRAPGRSELQAVILKAGQTPPDWWDSVQLDYPTTLDLAGTNRAEGWAPQRNLGTYMWSVVNPNPSRWNAGVKLLHQVLTVRKDDPPRLREAVELLAKSYQVLLRDWARAAFWWEKALTIGERPALFTVVSLAECYFRLGSKPMAEELLRKYGLDRLGQRDVIKLWAEMGEERRALQLAEMLARDRPEDGYLAAGNVARLAGRYPDALTWYKKVLDVTSGKPNNRNAQRARAHIEAIELYEAMDLSSIPDGTHSGSSTGFRGPVQVAVEVKGGKIVSVKVVQHREDVFYTSLTEVPRRIVEAQGLKRVDAVTGATITSEAIMNATAKALSEARK